MRSKSHFIGKTHSPAAILLRNKIKNAEILVPWLSLSVQKVHVWFSFQMIKECRDLNIKILTNSYCKEMNVNYEIREKKANSKCSSFDCWQHANFEKDLRYLSWNTKKTKRSTWNAFSWCPLGLDNLDLSFLNFWNENILPSWMDIGPGSLVQRRRYEIRCETQLSLLDCKTWFLGFGNTQV